MSASTIDIAHALHGSPCAYAVLLGSGISRAAGIKTGWDITLDLVGQLALVEDDDAASDPEQWWRDRSHTEPDYSELLELLAPTRDARGDRLRRYFEPTDNEREQGRKVPTPAHRALADLVQARVVRIIVTTNFDRLTEQALAEAGVHFDVWSTPDDIRGGRPLSHGQVVVVKLHGDYRDTRIRNTSAELGRYDEATDRLLDQIIDEFGLIVCGWSGKYDNALRAAIRRAPNRRYRLYWAARGDPEDEAQHLVDHRQGRVVPIEDADRFFTALRDTVRALQQRGARQPADAETMVAVVKRLLPDEHDRIRLTDAVIAEARRVYERTGPDRYPVEGVPHPTVDDVIARVHRYEAEVEVLAHALATLAYHGDRPDHTDLAARALELAVNTAGDPAGDVGLLGLRQYPALVGMYAAGLGAVAAENWPMLRAVLVEPRWHRLDQQIPFLDAVHPDRVFGKQEQVMRVLAGDSATPVADHLHGLLAEVVLPLVDTRPRYHDTFERFEYLTGVVAKSFEWRPWASALRLRRLYEHDYKGMAPAAWAKRNATELGLTLLHAPVPGRDPRFSELGTAWRMAMKGFTADFKRVGPGP